MVLACVPLLLPSGFCVCEAGKQCCTQTGCDRAGTLEGCDADAPKKSGCCHHRHDRDISIAFSDTPRHDPKPPGGQHVPGCPAASVDYDRSQATEPTLGWNGISPSSSTIAYVPFSPRVHHVQVCLTPQKRPSGPPIYLTHCSFVI